MSEPKNNQASSSKWLPLMGLLTLLFLPFLLGASYPAWWSDRGVVQSGASTNDYAAVNQGQVKHLATQARAELEAKLPGGAGTNITALINSFSAANANYAPVTVGQLKNLAKPFYDRLIATGYATNYPWSSLTSDDNDLAVANIGQAKFLFSFHLTSSDTDADGLSDSWEQQYFGNLNQTSNGDFDSDGLTNLQELNAGTDPTKSDSENDGMPDGFESAYGLDPKVNDGSLDKDNDGVENLTEYLQGRNPLKGAISDSTGAVDLNLFTPLE
jgi:hypothetical protein